jgi:signal transduction histidine kinase
MEGLRAFFLLNHDLIVFAYGQVFFILGLAIALQSRRYSQLQLARSLTWLAAFGFMHGLNEWGDLFIPIQATYLSPVWADFLYVLQLLLLSVSFACLMEFGIALLRPAGRWAWLHGLPVGLLAVWLMLAFVFTVPFAPDLTAWHHDANALARYLLGFPGGLVAALGLRQEALARIAPLQVPSIVRMLRLAGLCLGAYAVAGGLVPPAVRFFPGNVLNEAVFEQSLGFPALVVRSAIGLVLAVTIMRGLEIFDLETERRIEAMEREQILAAERERLARDLHDGTIQNVYSIGLIVDSAQRLAAPQSPAAERLELAKSVIHDAIRDLRRSLGELRRVDRPVAEPLAFALRRLTEDPRFSALAQAALEFELPADAVFSPERTSHLLAITGEALANAVRHGHATRMRVTVQHVDGNLKLEVHDNGSGGAGETSLGHGLRNMRERARLLGGDLSLASQIGKGTTVTLVVPWRESSMEGEDG